MARSDRVVDYTKEDFTKLGERHDLMLDIAGSRSFRAFRRVLTPEATVIDRRFELSQAADALRYLGEGHARGKVIISM